MDEFVLDSVDTYIGLHMLSNPVIPGMYSDGIPLDCTVMTFLMGYLVC